MSETLKNDIISEAQTRGINKTEPEQEKFDPVIKDNAGGHKEIEKRKAEEGNNDPRPSKRRKWKNRGMNKNRPTFKLERENKLCHSLADRQTDTAPACKVEGCKFIHNLTQFMEMKPPDIGEECYMFNTRGHCPRGITCRFSSKHVTSNGLNIVNERLCEEWKANKKLHTINGMNNDIQMQLRKRTYNFKKAENVLSLWGNVNAKKAADLVKNAETTESKTEVTRDEGVSNKDDNNKPETSINGRDGDEIRLSFSTSTPSTDIMAESETVINGNHKGHVEVGPILDNDTIKLRSEEKKKIDWSNKLFLSPLTTVGNLPFRRICKEFGADVTCGEMALAVNLLQGKPQEWALTKRHGSENLFGVQVCGGNVHVMTRCAQLLQEQADIDFLDINVGCPIELIYQQGAGSGLLNKKKVLFSMVKCMKSVLDIPLTVKTRTGVYSGKNVAHNMMKDLANMGADLITIHGRSKEQRYTKLADWAYVEQCAQLAAPVPVIGNGDILSYEDYDLARTKSPSAASIMIGRGALIKPWIFTEIKERRHWDISSQERFQMLQRYANYGLEHWGSDTKGVETTRRFLLEWLSFLYRYVPVGLLENPPQKMNERPPVFQGRDELEILMASPNCADWIKISEMLLGPVPDGFQFLPKHKANSWS